MNNILEHFTAHYETEYKNFMLQTDFVITLSTHSEHIKQFVSAAHSEAVRRFGGRSLLNGDQVKFPGTSARKRIPAAQKNEYLNEEKLTKGTTIGDQSYFEVMNLGGIKAWNLSEEQFKIPIDLRRLTFSLLPNVRQENKLALKFASVDTDELRDLEIKISGDRAQFKVGEGECNHYVIANDKKLWESQFVILSRDGQFYLRDLGVVHTSRLKVTAKTGLQLH